MHFRTLHYIPIYTWSKIGFTGNSISPLERFHFVVAGFFPKKDVSFAILDVSVFCNFCAPRETCVSALRFFDAPFAEVSPVPFPVGAAGASSARIDRT